MYRRHCSVKHRHSYFFSLVLVFLPLFASHALADTWNQDQINLNNYEYTIAYPSSPVNDMTITADTTLPNAQLIANTYYNTNSDIRGKTLTITSLELEDYDRLINFIAAISDTNDYSTTFTNNKVIMQGVVLRAGHPHQLCYGFSTGATGAVKPQGHLTYNSVAITDSILEGCHAAGAKWYVYNRSFGTGNTQQNINHNSVTLNRVQTSGLRRAELAGAISAFHVSDGAYNSNNVTLNLADNTITLTDINNTEGDPLNLAEIKAFGAAVYSIDFYCPWGTAAFNISNNIVTISGANQLIRSDLYGGYLHVYLQGTASTITATSNEVVVNGGVFNSPDYYDLYNSFFGVASDVDYSYNSSDGAVTSTANSNKVTINGGDFKSALVCAAFLEQYKGTGGNSMTLTNNQVRLYGGTFDPASENVIVAAAVGNWADNAYERGLMTLNISNNAIYLYSSDTQSSAITGEKLDLRGARLVGVTVIADNWYPEILPRYFHTNSNKLELMADGPVTVKSVIGFDILKFNFSQNVRPQLHVTSALSLDNTEILAPGLLNSSGRRSLATRSSGETIATLIVADGGITPFYEYLPTNNATLMVVDGNKLCLLSGNVPLPQNSIFISNPVPYPLSPDNCLIYVDPQHLSNNAVTITNTDQLPQYLDQISFITAKYQPSAPAANCSLKLHGVTKYLSSHNEESTRRPIIIASAITTSYDATNNRLELDNSSLSFDPSYEYTISDQSLLFDQGISGAISLGGNLTKNQINLKNTTLQGYPAISGGHLFINDLGFTPKYWGYRSLGTFAYTVSQNTATLTNVNLLTSDGSFVIAGANTEAFYNQEEDEAVFAQFRSLNVASSSSLAFNDNLVSLDNVNASKVFYGGALYIGGFVYRPYSWRLNIIASCSHNQVNINNLVSERPTYIAAAYWYTDKQYKSGLNVSEDILSLALADQNHLTIGGEKTSLGSFGVPASMFGAMLYDGNATNNTVTINGGDFFNEYPDHRLYVEALNIRGVGEDTCIAGASIRYLAFNGVMLNNEVSITDSVINRLKVDEADVYDPFIYICGAYVESLVPLPRLQNDTFEAARNESTNNTKIAGNRVTIKNASLNMCEIAGCVIVRSDIPWDFIVDYFNELQPALVTSNEVVVGNPHGDNDALTMQGTDLIGARSDAFFSDLTDNHVTINSGTFTACNIDSGFTRDNNLEANTAIINGGKFLGALIIGVRDVIMDLNVQYTIKNNSVTINGGQFLPSHNELNEYIPCIIAAAYAQVGKYYQETKVEAEFIRCPEPIMENNFVKISGNRNNLDLSSAYLAGTARNSFRDYDDGEVKKLSRFSLACWPTYPSNSQLIVATENVTALNIYFMDDINIVLPRKFTTSPLLRLIEPLDLCFTDQDGTTRQTKISVDAITNNTQYFKGAAMPLLTSEVGITGFSGTTFTDKSGEFTLNLSDDGKSLILTALQTKITQAMAIDVGTRSLAAGTVSVNNTMDIVASSLANQLSSGSSASNMMALGVGSSKVTTGSHVNATGGSLVLGLSRGFSRALAGIFVEGGLSHFDSYETRKIASGNNMFAGIGAILRLDSHPAYLTTAVHGGVLKTKSTFKTNTSYLGAYAELGWHVGRYVDTYMRYSYGRTGGIEETIDGMALSFEPTTSHRGRIGTKLILSDHFAKPYVGLAFEREFKGETKGVVVNEAAVAAPSTQGNTGVVELGVELDIGKHLATHVNLEGCFGRRQGFSGGIGLEYKL